MEITLKIDFDIKNEVLIKELGKTGRIVSVYYSEIGLQYSVRHWENNAYTTNYYFREELDNPEEKEKKLLGFKTEKV